MAASRVNTKFVVILVAGLVAVAVVGVGGVYFVVANNAERLVTMGDKATQEGNVIKAELLYSKAVNREQTNPEYLRKWIASMEKLTPETENAYRSKYQDYFAANQALASRAMQRDVQAHRVALGLIHRDLRDYPGYGASSSDLVAAVDRALEFFRDATDNKADVLRKYSGLALLRGYEAAANLRDDEIERSRTDLEKAFAADPTDGEVAAGLSRWHDRTAYIKASRQDMDAAQTDRATARKIISDFVAANPRDPFGQMWALASLVADQETAINAITDPQTRSAAAAKATTDIAARIDQFASSLDALPLEKPEPSLIDRLAAFELRFKPAGPAGAIGLLDKLIVARPKDTRMLLSKAGLLGETRREKEALDVLDKLVGIPQQPVSYEGISQFFHRTRARYLQAVYTLRLWGAEKDPAAKKALLDAARAYRAELAKVAEADSTELLYVDASLSVAAEDFGQALTKLLDYNRRTNNGDTQALWLGAQCAVKVLQEGTAETMLRELLRRSPNDKQANVFYADLLVSRLRRESEGLEFYRRASAIDPSDEQVKRLIAILEAKLSGETSSGSLGETEKALLDHNKLTSEGKAAEAFAVIKAAYDKTADPRLAPLVAQTLKFQGKKDEAVQLLEGALAKFPSNITLQQALVITRTEDPLERAIGLIDLSNAAETEKLVQKSQTYAIFGKKDKSDEALAAAVAKSPDHPAVIELQFVKALEAKDIPAAERYAKAAADKNLDFVRGATFRARVLDSQNRTADAVRELEGVQTSQSFTPNAGRMLAEMLNRQGRLNDAVQVLRDALQKRNTDRDCLYALGLLLVQLDQGRIALTELKARQELHPADTQIQNLYLDLEAMYGDRELAKERRRRNLDLRPDSLPDQLSLAQLLVDSREFPEARLRIDNLKKTPEGRARVTDIEAQWYASQGDMNGAKRAFDEFLTSVDATKVTPEVLLAKGRFLEGREQINDAAAAYKDAAKSQSAQLEADKALADLHTRMGELGDARVLLEKIVDGKADDAKNTYAKRLIEVLLRMEKSADAITRLQALGPAINEDSQMLIQQAEAVRQSGDEKKAVEIIDQAVAKFPNDPYVFYRRAMMNVKYPELRADVLRDLEKSVTIRPGFWQARRDRARIWVEEGKFDDAIKEMREAVKYNPRINELRVQLVRDLLAQRREVEANEVIQTVLESRPGDIAVLLNSGDLFREARLNDQAREYYRRAFEISKQLQVVTRYVDLLHSLPQPDVNEVDRVLISVRDLIDKEPALLMARAKQLLIRGKTEDGIKDIVASARLIRPNQPGLVMAWGSDIKRLLATPADVTKVMEIVDRENLIPGWTNYFKAGTLIEKEETRDQARLLLEEMVKTTTDAVLVRQAYILLHAYYYQKNDCDNSLRTLNASVEKFPDDSFILNNLAYTMLVCGKDPATIVPVAERAIQSMLASGRSTADLWDTMGIVYVRANMLDKAMQPLRAALAEAGNSYVRATILLHISEFFIKKGDKTKALEAFDEAKKIVDANPKSAEIAKHPEEVARLQALLDAMK